MNHKNRESNIELFRIIIMILIIAHHYVVNSGLTFSWDAPIYSDILSPHSIFLLIFGAWGKIGINCFVLITGYFMCVSQITARKFVKLLGEVMFYRFFIAVAFWISGYAPFSITELVKTIIPIKEISTDFTSTYLVFFLFIPFLNILIHNMNERQHISIIALCGFTYVFFGTLRRVSMNYVSWFMVLYLVAAYVRVYHKDWFDNKVLWCAAMCTSLGLSMCSVLFCAYMFSKGHQISAFTFVTDSNTFLALTTGVSAFMFFKNLHIQYNKVINTLAATTFGVFLIHTNSDAMRQWLWCDLLNNTYAYSQKWMYLHAILSVLIIFVLCSCIDILRIRFIETPFFVLWDKKWDQVEKKIINLLNISQ